MNPTQKQPPLSATKSFKKRFRIVKLEERIAPGNGGHGNGSNATCGQAYTCYQCATDQGCGSISGSIGGSYSTSTSY